MYKIRYKSHHDAKRKVKDIFKDTKTNPFRYVQTKLNKIPDNHIIMYIHVPFCAKICKFCPFNTPNDLNKDTYHKLVIDELSKMKDYPYFKGEIGSIYFGGGTPTSLKPEQIDEILTYLKTNFKYKKDIEICLETSVTELTDEMLEVLKKGKVNRLSIGVQTFDNKLRQLLGRRGTGEFAYERIKKIIAYGFDNTSIDLIYNIPGQTLEMLKEDLRKIVELNLAGLSFYSLQVFKGTPLDLSLTKKEKDELNNLENDLKKHNLIIEYLGKHGYEVLQFLKLVKDKRDKYLYVDLKSQYGDCIAVGHGAGGSIGCYSYYNITKAPRIPNTNISVMGSMIKPELQTIDMFVYDLQKNNLSYKKYKKLLNIDLEKILEKELKVWEKEGYIKTNKDNFRFTNTGIFFGNNIISDILYKLVEGNYFKAC